MPRVALIGDSIRRHYGPHVAQQLGGDGIEVWDPEENCGSSRIVRSHIAGWIKDQGFDVVHVNCGLHDVRRHPGAVRPEVGLEEYRANVDAILAALVGWGLQVVWATSTPVDEARHRAARFSDRRLEDVVTYNEASLEVARRWGVACNDLYGAVTEVGAGGVLGEDGVHCTPEGYAFLAGRVVEAVRGVLVG